jgi:hypothetical protein
MPLQFPGCPHSARGERAVGQRPGHLTWVEGNGSSSLPSSTRRPQDAQLPAERAPQSCPAPEIRSPSGAGRNERPWLNRREHLFTKQGVAGSSPAGRAVSEAEVGDAPGCAPGGSGFEPRRTPQYYETPAPTPVLRVAGRGRYAVPAALAQLVEASGLGPGGSGFESLGPHRTQHQHHAPRSTGVGKPHRQNCPGCSLSGTLEERRNQA